jgi:hypothetical protein
MLSEGRAPQKRGTWIGAAGQNPNPNAHRLAALESQLYSSDY